MLPAQIIVVPVLPLPRPALKPPTQSASPPCRFLVKTVRHSEMRLLLSLIPLYYRHVQANPGTLLTRFYGVHRLTPIIGRQVRRRLGSLRAGAALRALPSLLGCANHSR